MFLTARQNITASKEDSYDPFVYSTVSLTKSLVKESISLLIHIKLSMLMFLLKKNGRRFCTAKAPHIFSAKMVVFLLSKNLKFYWLAISGGLFL